MRSTLLPFRSGASYLYILSTSRDKDETKQARNKRQKGGRVFMRFADRKTGIDPTVLARGCCVQGSPPVFVRVASF